ncbi:sigma-70 family RNA polymerase sigma factor [Clostridium bovifaecis]|uniref:Sigma-70 family RNA polymerase sigma factor n=1 Tax=Clostridium bovifaecis TaxID=2184719 RepID=A0A6I6FGA2_9CLOT|nr:sigma-70 family RNA polymerase sigma factor [Clostridium bovifaecis]
MEKETERLMNLYGNDVLRISYLYLKDMQGAEDAFQEVFFKIYKKYSSFNGKSSEKTWVISITINVCKDLLRSSWLKRIFLTDKIIPEEHEDTDKSAIKLVENRILLDEVMSLKPSLKDVVVLYYYQQFDTKEISKILGIAEGTVRSRLHRAREILKNKLNGRIDYFE